MVCDMLGGSHRTVPALAARSERALPRKVSQLLANHDGSLPVCVRAPTTGRNSSPASPTRSSTSSRARGSSSPGLLGTHPQSSASGSSVWPGDGLIPTMESHHTFGSRRAGCLRRTSCSCQTSPSLGLRVACGKENSAKDVAPPMGKEGHHALHF